MERTGSVDLEQPLPPSGAVPLDDGRRRLTYPVERPEVGDKILVIWERDATADERER